MGKRQGETAIREKGAKYLERRGWLVVRYDAGKYVGWSLVVLYKRRVLQWMHQKTGPFPEPPWPRSIGKTGWPDQIALRHNFDHGWDQVMFLEVKAAGKKPSDDQVEIHEQLRAEGFLVVWYDSVVESDGGKMPLAPWYEGSGL